LFDIPRCSCFGEWLLGQPNKLRLTFHFEYVNLILQSYGSQSNKPDFIINNFETTLTRQSPSLFNFSIDANCNKMRNGKRIHEKSKLKWGGSFRSSYMRKRLQSQNETYEIRFQLFDRSLSECQNWIIFWWDGLLKKSLFMQAVIFNETKIFLIRKMMKKYKKI